jgi:hypothetical protein
MAAAFLLSNRIARYTYEQFSETSQARSIAMSLPETYDTKKEDWMSKILLAGLAALFITVPSVSYAQAPTGQVREVITEAASKALTDRRVEVVKFGLALTPDQAKLWPPVEEAIRARTTARHQRLAKLAALRNGQRDRSEFNPVDLIRERSEVLAQRSAGLKGLADAWQPLYASLDNNQKLRLRFLAVFVLREMRDAVESRLTEAEEEDDSEF